MNHSLKTPLSCFLALSATAAMAAGGTENSLATLGAPLAVQVALPSVHVDIGGNQKKVSERVSLEGFWPFMQQEEQLLFLQGGWLRQQQRNLLSAGLGWRYFPESDWGVGSNLFYDQDLTRQHHRVGLGAEAWWQSLTLTANGYLPTSSWQTAPDLKGYRERPAKGYDVSLKGYLPALPHLGASVRYAHYVGDEVALSHSKHRQRNPKQWRWGVDFTPIPLLTLAYHQSPGLSGDAKHQISAALTYRFALPLSQQLDPTQVAAFHSAQGQRLAHVQREQLMALQYAASPKVEPKPSEVLPKELTLEDIEKYKEKIETAMQDLKDHKNRAKLVINALWDGIKDTAGIKGNLSSADEDYTIPWGKVYNGELDDKEVNKEVDKLIGLYDKFKGELEKDKGTNNHGKRWRAGLDQLQAFSNQYIAEKKKLEDCKNLKSALEEMEKLEDKQKKELDNLATAKSNVAEAQKKVDDLKKNLGL